MSADFADLEIIGDLDRRSPAASPGLLLPVYRLRSDPGSLFIDRDAPSDGWPSLLPVPGAQLEFWQDEGRFSLITPPIPVRRWCVLVMLGDSPEYLASAALEGRLDEIFRRALDQADQAIGAGHWAVCERALVRCAHARHGDPLVAAAMVVLARDARPTAVRALLKQAVPQAAALRSHERWKDLRYINRAIVRDPDLGPLLARAPAPARAGTLGGLCRSWGSSAARAAA